MGQKVNPIGLRLGINRTWDSRWFARKEYGNLLLDDLGLRKFLHRRLAQAGLSRVIIERAARKSRITLHSARPGVIIGKKGVDIEKLRVDIAKVTTSEVSVNIVEIRKPEIDAKLIAESIAQQLERRVAFRRVMKRAVQSAIRLGAPGRRGGSPIAPRASSAGERRRAVLAAARCPRRSAWRRSRACGFRRYLRSLRLS